MARIEPVDPATASGRTKVLLDEVEAALGVVPNMAKTLAASPAALEAWLRTVTALSKGRLGGALGTQIALATAEANHCGYCLAAHSYVGANVNKLSSEAILASRRGRSDDPRADAALRFARAVLDGRGSVSEADIKAVRSAGFDDAQIAEIFVHVALNVLTNYFNKAIEVEIDFPLAEAA